MRPAAGIGAHERVHPLRGGRLRERELGGLDVVGGGVRAGIAGPEHDRERLPGFLLAAVGERGHGMTAERLLPCRPAWSFSEWEITIVASRSTITCRPAPGAAKVIGDLAVMLPLGDCLADIAMRHAAGCCQGCKATVVKSVAPVVVKSSTPM